MTKKEYIKHAMRLCPTRKYWREQVEKAIRAGCIDVNGAENYREVYPLRRQLPNGWPDSSSTARATQPPNDG